MPPTEQTQYAIVCKERFDRLEKYASETHKAIVGNGTEPGLTGRMLLVEAEQTTIKSRWKWIFGIIAVVVAASIIPSIQSISAILRHLAEGQ